MVQQKYNRLTSLSVHSALRATGSGCGRACVRACGHRCSQVGEVLHGLPGRGSPCLCRPGPSIHPSIHPCVARRPVRLYARAARTYVRTPSSVVHHTAPAVWLDNPNTTACGLVPKTASPTGKNGGNFPLLPDRDAHAAAMGGDGARVLHRCGGW